MTNTNKFGLSDAIAFIAIVGMILAMSAIGLGY